MTRTPDLLITNQLLYRLSYASAMRRQNDAASKRKNYTITGLCQLSNIKTVAGAASGPYLSFRPYMHMAL